MKRIGLFALAVLLALPLTSCTATAEEDSREVNPNLLAEKRVTLPDESPRILDICNNDNDYTIVSTDEDRAILHRSTLTLTSDGQSEQSNLVEIARAESGWFIYAATISPEGNVVYSCALDEDTIKHYLIDTEGKAEEIELEPTAIISLDYVDSDSLIVENMARNLMRVKVDSGAVETSYDRNDGQLFFSYVVTDAKLIAITGEVVDDTVASSAKVFDLASGDEISDSAELVQAIDSTLTRESLDTRESEPILSQDPKTGKLYVLSKGSVYSISADNEVSLWAAGDDTNLLNAAMDPLALLPNDKGFVALYYDRGTSTYKLYSYNFGRPKAEKTLSVYMLEDNPEIRQVVSSYREQNENIEMVVRVGLPSGTTLTVDDAIKQLNLDILAGNGPDIIVLDGLSIDRFQKEKLLVDLSDVVSRLKTTDSEYFENVLSCFEDEESSCYAIPTRFTIPSIVANEELLRKIESLEDLTEIVESYRGEKQTFLGSSCDLSLLFTTDYGNIVQGDSVSKEELSRFFEQAKRMIAVAAETFELNSQTNINVIDDALKGFTDSSSFLRMTGLGVLEPLTSLAEMGSIKSTWDLPYVNLAINHSANNLAFGLLKFTDKQVFSPNTILGISSSSSNIDSAKQFIEFSLSNEQQKSDQWTGLPVNRTVFTEALERVASEEAEVSFGGEYSYTYGPLSEEEFQAHLDLVDSVETANVTDRIITDLVKEGLESYLRDQMSFDEAVEATYQRISLYILEQT